MENNNSFDFLTSIYSNESNLEETEELTAISYAKSNSKTGKIYYNTLDIKEKKLINIVKESNGKDQITKTYQVDDDVILEITKIVTKYDMSKWSSFEVDYSYIDNDLPSENLLLYYGSKCYTISFYATMKEDEKRLCIYVQTLLAKQIDEKKLIDEKIQSADELKNIEMLG